MATLTEAGEPRAGRLAPPAELAHRAAEGEMLMELVEGILSLMREQVVSIVLYGSVARGDQTPESDIDIALILRGKMDAETESKLLDIIVDMNLKYNTVFSIIDIDEAVFLKWRKALPFYGNIEREGIVLWKAA